jgi:hypothetical protein
MATTTELRRAVARLSSIAASDLDVVWRRAADPRQTRRMLEGVLPPLIDHYATASAALAADWYDERREEASPRRRFRARAANLRDGGGGLVLARYAVGPMFGAEPDLARAQTLVAGGVQLRIANSSRDTITESAIADPDAQGWQRESSGGCPFCDMLASRGEVYSEESADFAAHDNCECVAVPAFVGEPKPVKEYTPTNRNITDADRARVREYIRTQ